MGSFWTVSITTVNWIKCHFLDATAICHILSCCKKLVWRKSLKKGVSKHFHFSKKIKILRLNRLYSKNRSRSALPHWLWFTHMVVTRLCPSVLWLTCTTQHWSFLLSFTTFDLDNKAKRAPPCAHSSTGAPASSVSKSKTWDWGGIMT